MNTKRKISPPLSDIQNLRQKLTHGEESLVRLLDQELPPVWDIYIQPHLNGLCPDILLLNPFVGVVVIEVKDWDFDAMSYHWERATDGKMRTLWATRDGKKFRKENPLEKAKLYVSEILELYCPSVGTPLGFAPVVSSVVYFSKLTTERARRFVKEGFEGAGVKDEVIEKYYSAIGHDALKSGVRSLIPFLNMTSSKHMKEEAASDLRYWLDEPRSKRDQRTPFALSVEQKKLTDREKTANGFRRIRGSAGSGKSQVLAAKAANLALEGKKVLVVTYNITLGNYLGDLVVRAALPNRGVRNNIVFLNYHMWAKRVCIYTGNEERYKMLDWDKDLDQVLSVSLPTLLIAILEESVCDELKYDAVLVDEGQDFRLLWWKSLTQVVRENGEAILVADKTQDLYESASAWTDEAMTSAGFRGPWNELRVSFRMPPDYVPFIKDFLARYIPGDAGIPPEKTQISMSNLTHTHMRWVQVPSQEIAIQCSIEEVLKFPLRKRASDNLVYSDIVVIAETIGSGYQIVRGLGKNGIKVRHTFGMKGEGDESEIIRKQKVSLFLGAEQVKATTVHSYKGWESTCLVVQISTGSTKSSIAAVYTALTRLKASERGEDSFITVVCSAIELEQYGRTWADFVRR